jgi:S-adenosyl-L-methionine hydrolase (adenosine-forming)
VDITHGIAPQHILQGALVLANTLPYMPEGVHLAVVDPEVGGDRKAVALRGGERLYVGPDNGLLLPAAEKLGGVEDAVEITNEDYFLHPVSRTFHGRDVFAPAAAWLARGMPLEELGPTVDAASLVALELPRAMVTPGAVGARVIAVDGFGNAQLNATRDDLEAAGLAAPDRLVAAGRDLPLVGAFAELPDRGLGLLEDSQGMLALVVNRGSAADRLRLKVGDPVVIEGSVDPGITPTVMPIA